MENFKSQLNEVTTKLIELSDTWDNLKGEEYHEVNENYTLHKNFEEIIRDFVEWQSNLKSNLNSVKTK